MRGGYYRWGLRGRGGPSGETSTEEGSRKAVEEDIRRCLETHDGSFDPANVSRKRYGLQPDETPPWEKLNALLGKEQLRDFVTQHSDFRYTQHGPKGMRITWATRHAPGASAGHQDQALPVQEGGAASSGSTVGQASPTHSFYSSTQAPRDPALHLEALD